MPHKQAGHMTAPDQLQNVNLTLAKMEPSTHDPKRTFVDWPMGGLINIKALIHNLCLNCFFIGRFPVDDGNKGRKTALVTDS